MTRILPALLLVLGLCGCAQRDAEPPSAELKFEALEIETGFGIGYAVVAADINGNGKTDVFAINETQAVWWENPSWEKHVVMDGETEPDNVCIAAHDINGNGRIDMALGAAWRPRDTEGGGTLQWLEQPEDPREPWTVHPIGAEPTLHRIRWGDVDGNGERELIAGPLHGRGTSGPKHWEGAGVRLLVLRPQSWSEEVADDSFHILHNFWVGNFDDDPAEEILTASYQGVHLLDRSPGGDWSRTKLGDGYQGEDIRGAGEIKLGRLANGKRYIATIEPWHANHLVVYEEPENPREMWPRRVVASELGGGHALWTGDMNGNGNEEVVFGWRQEGEGDFARPGVGIADPRGWSYQIVDSGGMAAEDLTLADFNGDGLLDIVAVGRATSNVKIYLQVR